MTSSSSAAAPAVPQRSFLARWGWPIGIATVLLTSAGSNLYVMMIAKEDPAFAVEPDYYKQAVDWDAHMAQEKANAALGWQANAALTLAVPGTAGELAVSLIDAQGQPLAGAQVTAEAMHNARASQRYEVALHEASPGRYAAAIDAHRPGEWEVRLTVLRAGQRFTHVARLTSGAPTAAR